MCVGEGINKHRYEICIDEVIVPFIKQSCTQFGGYERGTLISEGMKTLSWWDIDLAHINSESLQFYADNIVCVAKQNAARSGSEHVADITKIFLKMQSLEKIVRVYNVPIKRHPKKIILYHELRNLHGREIILKATKID